MSKYDYYKLFNEHFEDAVSELNSEDFKWLLERIKEDMKELED